MVSVIIAAGGKGVRMQADIRKQYMILDDIPILSRAIRPFDQSPLVDRIILTVPEEDIGYCRRTIIDPYGFQKKIDVIKGGKERQSSVYEGLKQARGSEIVMIHDGVRPFITPEMVETAVSETRKYNAVIFALPAFETLKQADKKNRVLGTIDRKKIWMAQTPQSFDYSLIMNAHQDAVKKNIKGTDDASLLEKTGQLITILQGTRFNIKITTPEDLKLAEAILPLFSTTL